MEYIVTILDHEEVHKRLVDYDAKDPWAVVSDTCKRIKYFRTSDDFIFQDTIYYYFCVFDGEKLVGCAKIKVGGIDSAENPGWPHWLAFVSVDPEYQNRGIGTAIIKSVMQFCYENGMKLLISDYSKSGWEYIKDRIRGEASLLGVEIRDRSTKAHY